MSGRHAHSSRSNDQKGQSKTGKRQTTVNKDTRNSASKGKGPTRPAKCASQPPSDSKILIIGNSGNGKSTIGNILVGESRFRVSQQTETVQNGFVHRQGIKITVVDTPDISMIPEHGGERNNQIRSIKSAVPDIVLVAIRCDKKGYTRKEFEAYKTIADNVDKRGREKFVVAFTFDSGDIDTIIAKASVHLRNVLKDAQQRYVVFGKDSLNLVKAKELSPLMNLFLPDSFSFDTPPEDDSRFAHHEATYSENGATSRQRLAAHCDSRPGEPLRLLIVGEMGSGKSTLANMILRRDAFETGSGMSVMTQTAQKEMTFIDNVQVEVVDTPDIVNSKRPHDREGEVAKWKKLTHSKPDAVILTIRSDDRYTPEKKSIYTETKSLLGDDLSPVLVLAFTFVDQRENDFERDLQKAGKHLYDVMKEADGRHVIVPAKAATSAKDAQVSKLIGIVRGLARH